MQPVSYSVSVTTDGSGAATARTDGPVSGRLAQIIYTADGSTPYDNTVDFTITGNTTGQSLLAVSNVSASTTYAPRIATCSTTGSAALYAAGGTAVNDLIGIANERIKIVLAQGGATKTGTFTFILV